MNEEFLPPQNVEAEQSILGAMLQDQNAIVKVSEQLKEEDFYREAHKKIFTAIFSLFQKGQEVDILTVIEELKKTSDLETVGGITYVSNLPLHCISISGVDRHIQIVKEKSKLRSLLTVTNQIQKNIYSNSIAASDILDQAESHILALSQDVIGDKIIKGHEAIYQAMADYVNRQCSNAENYLGIPSGYSKLDEITSGFRGGNLIIIAGRPGMGKTSFALNLAKYVIMKKNKSCLFFSLEMSQTELAQNLISSICKINNKKFDNGVELTPEESLRYTEASDSFMDKNFFIDTHSRLTIDDIKTKCRMIKAKYGLDFVIIDYLQLLSASCNNFNVKRYEIVSNFSRELKNLAGELNIPIITLSQLNRNVESRDNKRPMLYDLRESGAIEQDADMVLFLYREKYYKDMNQQRASTGEEIEPVEVLVAKNRRGATGIVKLGFAPAFSSFYNYSS